MVLSILIPTLQKRRPLFQLLHQHLTSQIEALGLQEQIVIIPLENNGQANIGMYRNQLIAKTQSEYVVFVDDDDWVTDNYVSEIWAALQSKPAVVTFNGWMTTDGAGRVDWVLKLGEAYEERGGLYYRYPNHLCPIKREIALRVPFKDVKHQEDFQWATAIRDKGLLKTEVHIDKQLYHYRFKTNK